LFRQYFINQQGGTFGHPPRPTCSGRNRDAYS
jgi:hypothetical protein